MPLNPRSRHWLKELTRELRRGKVEERRLITKKGEEWLDGLSEGQKVIINPIPATIHTLIHELIHRRYPQWSESYVRARTSEICRRLSDSEELALFVQYQKVVRRKKRCKFV